MSWENFRLSKRLNLDPSKLEKVYSLLSEIDGVKNSWKITAKLLPQTIERLTQSVLVTSTGSSNRIEGNKLSDSEVEALYRNLRVKKFKTRDEQEIAGYLECLEMAFKNFEEIPIRESSILQLHSEMLVHTKKDQRHRGSYKFGSNRVEARDPSGAIVGVIFDPTPPHLVKKEMLELVEWYNWAVETKQKHPLLLIANFIFEYLAIHPFQDGNGRTSRLLTNTMLLQQGYLFTQFVSHERIVEANKVDYYQALNRTQRSWKTESEDMSSWILFFLGVMKAQSAQALKIMSGENIEYLLTKKQLELWQWAQNNPAPFSRKDAVLALGFPERTVETIIKKMVSYKKLERVGQGSGTRYKVR